MFLRRRSIADYGMSDKTLRGIVKRDRIPKLQKDKFVYSPKELADDFFS